MLVKECVNQVINFAIVDIYSEPLLGLDACVKLKLLLKVNFCETLKFVNKDDTIIKYSDVFSGLGKFPGKHHITLKEDAIPKLQGPRRVPQSLSPRLKRTLDELEKKGVVS